MRAAIKQHKDSTQIICKKQDLPESHEKNKNKRQTAACSILINHEIKNTTNIASG